MIVLGNHLNLFFRGLGMLLRFQHVGQAEPAFIGDRRFREFFQRNAPYQLAEPAESPRCNANSPRNIMMLAFSLSPEHSRFKTATGEFPPLGIFPATTAADLCCPKQRLFGIRSGGLFGEQIDE